jgi:hypothetical protein
VSRALEEARTQSAAEIQQLRGEQAAAAATSRELTATRSQAELAAAALQAQHLAARAETEDKLSQIRAQLEGASARLDAGQGALAGVDAKLPALRFDLGALANDLRKENGSVASGLEAKIAEVRAQLAGAARDLQAQSGSAIAGVNRELAGLQAQLAASAADLRSQSGSALSGLKGQLQGLRTELAAAKRDAEAGAVAANERKLSEFRSETEARHTALVARLDTNLDEIRTELAGTVRQMQARDVTAALRADAKVADLRDETTRKVEQQALQTEGLAKELAEARKDLADTRFLLARTALQLEGRQTSSTGGGPAKASRHEPRPRSEGR